MKCEEIIVAKADVKELYDEILSKSDIKEEKIILLMAKTFLLASDCENLCTSDKNKSA